MPSQDLFSEEMLFSPSISAGEFAFSAQDARRSNGELNDVGAQDQAHRTLENLNVALKTAGLDLGSVASLMVYLPDYVDAAEVAQVLGATLGKNDDSYPATTILGVAGLEGGCRVRMDAIAIKQRLRSIAADGAATDFGQSLPRGSRREFLILIMGRCG